MAVLNVHLIFFFSFTDHLNTIRAAQVKARPSCKHADNPVQPSSKGNRFVEKEINTLQIPANMCCVRSVNHCVGSKYFPGCNGLEIQRYVFLLLRGWISLMCCLCDLRERVVKKKKTEVGGKSMHIWLFLFVSCVDDNKVDWNLESEMRQDGRIREAETHQESQTISWGNATPPLPEFNPHGKPGMAMRLHGDRDGGFSCCCSQARGVGFDWLYIHRDSDCRKLWQSQAFFLQRSTGERCVFVAEKQPGEGYFSLYNWVILSVTLMCHKAVFHVPPPPHPPSLILHKLVANEYHMWLGPERRSRVI